MLLPEGNARPEAGRSQALYRIKTQRGQRATGKGEANVLDAVLASAALPELFSPLFRVSKITPPPRPVNAANDAALDRAQWSVRSLTLPIWVATGRVLLAQGTRVAPSRRSYSGSTGRDEGCHAQRDR